MNASSHTPLPLCRRFALAAVGAAASCLIALPMVGCSSPAPDLHAFQDAFAEQEAELLEGVALDDYVEPSDYSFSFDLSEPETEDGVTSTDGTVTVSNDSFETTYDVSGTCEDGKFSFSVEEGETVPVAGVDFDDEHDFNGAESELVGSDACEVTTTQSVETWFATVTFDKTYRYEFVNDAAGSHWSFAGESVNSSDIQYQEGALDGSYAFQSGSTSEGSLSSFAISAYNAADGTFTVDYANSLTSGTATCQIEAIELDENALEAAQADGTAIADAYQFRFSGRSTTDNDATIDGCLTAADGTLVVDCWMPVSSFDVMGYGQEVYGSVSGTLTK